MTNRSIGILCVLALLLFNTAAVPAVEHQERFEKLVERLYLNHLNLKNVYRDLHDIAIDRVSGPEMQLSYIQKTYLFVSEASLIGFYQWELLCATEYIREERISDYLTLRVKDLDRAIFETRDRVNSLKLYQAFIDNDSAQMRIDEAIGLLDANIYMYEEIMALLKPLANPENPFRRDRKDL